jgi:hypothetical protein
MCRDKLYCALTCQLLAKSLDAVRQHMGGKKFQRAKGAARLPASRPPLLQSAMPDVPVGDASVLWTQACHHCWAHTCAERYQNDELELMEEPSLRDSPSHTEVRDICGWYTSRL